MISTIASGAVDSGLIPSRVKSLTVKLVFTAYLIDTQHEMDSVKNKLASSLIVPLEKVSGISPSSSDEQVPGTFKRLRCSALIAFS